MPTYKPVDFDPFASAAPSGGVKVRPVDFDPFAKRDPAADRDIEETKKRIARAKALIADYDKRLADPSKIAGGEMVVGIASARKAAADSIVTFEKRLKEIERTGKPAPDATIGGFFSDLGRGALRAVTQAPGQVAEGALGLIGSGMQAVGAPFGKDLGLEDLGKEVSQRGKNTEAYWDKLARENFGERSAAANFDPIAKLGADVGEGIGSTAPFLVTQGLGGVATRLSTAGRAANIAGELSNAQKIARAANYGIAGGQGSQGAGQMAQEFRDTGGTVTPGQEALVRFGGAGLGLTQVGVIDRMLEKLPTSARAAAIDSAAKFIERATLGRVAPQAMFEGVKKTIADVEKLALGRVALSSFDEAAQEGGEQFGQNVLAKTVYNPDQALSEGVVENALLGGIVGGVLKGGVEGTRKLLGSNEDTGTPPPPSSSRASRPPPPPPAPPADMGALTQALGPVGGKVTLNEPSGPRDYTFEGIDEDGGVILADEDGVIYSEDPAQVQAAIKAGVVEPKSGLGGMAFGMDITEGLPDVVAPPPPPPPPPPTAAREKFTLEPPPPNPRNTQRQSKVGNVIFDQEKGVGQVPLNQNVNYRGFTAMMRPSKFLELAADLENPKQSSLDYIRQSVDEGKGVGSPFLNLDFETGKVKSHDGRHRMMVIQEKNGDVPVPVHIFGKGEQRARSLDEGKISSFASSMTGEDGRPSTDNFSEAFLDEVAVPVAAPPEAALQFSAEDGWVESVVEEVGSPNNTQQRFVRNDNDGIRNVRVKDGSVVADILTTDYDAFDLDGDPFPVRVIKNNITGKARLSSIETGKAMGDITALLEAGIPVEEAIRRMIDTEGPLPTKAAKIGSTTSVPKSVQPPPPPPPPAAPRAVGKTARATIPATGEKVDVQYELQDLDNINFAQDELQNRDRSRPASGAFITDFVKKFDPDRLGEHPETDRGAPVINKDNIILSGNGRTMGLQEIYGFHPDKAEIYKESLREQGYDIEGIERPVLVRRLMSDVNERKFVTASNEDDKAALSPPEQAAQDASDILTPGVFAKFNGGDLNAVKNDAFVSAFIAEMSTQQRKNAMDDKGKVNAQTLKRIENALLYKAYGDSSRASKIFISKAMERNDDDTKTLTNSLVDVSKDWIKFQQAIEAGEIDKKYNITNKLMETIGTASDIKASGNSVAFELRSPDMVEPMDPFVREILLAFHNDDVSRILSRKAIAEKLKAYTEVAAVQQAEPDMLGMSETPSARDIWRRIDKGEGAPQSDLYASIAEPSTNLTDTPSSADIMALADELPPAQRVNVRASLNKILNRFDKNGKVYELLFGLEDLYTAVDNRIKRDRENKDQDRVRGFERAMERSYEGERTGKITPESAKLLRWLLQKNPAIAEELALSFEVGAKSASAGVYDSADRVATIFSSKAKDGTAVHEVLHHTERLLPQKIRDGIRAEWTKRIKNLIEIAEKTNNTDARDVLGTIVLAYYGDSVAQRELKESYEAGTIPYSMYHLSNPSEFWAVNATELVAKRAEQTGWVGGARKWLEGFIESAKDFFGLNSNSAVIKGLDAVLKQESGRTQGEMIGAGGRKLRKAANKKAQEETEDNKQIADDLLSAASQDDNKPKSKRVTAVAAAAALASSPVNATINDTPIAPSSALYKSLESGDTKKAIELIQKNSKNPAARRIATILANNGVGEQKTVILDPINNLDKTIATLSKNGADLDDISLVTTGDVRGMVLPTAKDKNIYLISNPDQKSNGVNEQTFLHEAIHAYVKARWSRVETYGIENNREILDNRGLYNEDVAAEVKKFNDMWRKFRGVIEKELEDGATLTTTVISAAGSPNEALSYLLTNEGVQNYAKRIVKDGSGYRLMSKNEAGKRSWWDDFVDMIRKIFGMAPARDQFFNDFLDAGNSVLAVGKKTKADFRVAAIDDESDSPKNVTNNEQAMKALINGTPDQMRDAVAKAQKPYDKSNEEAAKLQSKNRGCD